MDLFQYSKNYEGTKTMMGLSSAANGFSIAKIMRVLKLFDLDDKQNECFSIAKIMRVLKLYFPFFNLSSSFSIAKIMRVLKPTMR